MHCHFPKQLEALKEILSENKNAKNKFWQKSQKLIAALYKNKSSQKLKENIELDFTNLFIGTKKCLAPPYESVWCSKEKLVMQKETAEVRKFYHQAGLKVKNQGQIPDDHIGIELEFMAFLLTKILESEQKKDKKNYQKFLRLKNKFLKEHLLSWAPNLCDEIIKYSSTNFYRAVSFLIKGLLN